MSCNQNNIENVVNALSCIRRTNTMKKKRFVAPLAPFFSAGVIQQLHLIKLQ